MVLTHFPSHLKNVSDNRAVKYAFSCYSYVFFCLLTTWTLGKLLRCLYSKQKSSVIFALTKKRQFSKEMVNGCGYEFIAERSNQRMIIISEFDGEQLVSRICHVRLLSPGLTIFLFSSI